MGPFIAIIFLFSPLEDKPPPRNFGFFLHSGFSTPGSPDTFPKYWDTGVNFGCGIGYSLFFLVTGITFRANFDYSQLALKKEEYTKNYSELTGLDIDGGSTDIITGSLNLQISSLMSTFQPYFMVEAGLLMKTVESITYMQGSNVETFTPAQCDTAVSLIFFGAGLNFVYTKMIDVFAEGGYRIYLTEDGYIGYFPIKLGVKIKL
ncbi:hypothetical protein KAW50_00940 [candidate division WOR-3 bacterium]|nr:hypothetical protein [candidate division WOR-3 bacterium]